MKEKKLKFRFFNVYVSFSPTRFRRWFRWNINSVSKTVATKKVFFGLLPFFIGTGHIISSKYQNQIFSYFFDKNLPGISLPYQTMSWQTFESTQPQGLNDNEVQQIDLYHDSIVIQFQTKQVSNPATTITIRAKSDGREQAENKLDSPAISPKYQLPIENVHGFFSAQTFQFFHLLSELVSKNYYYRLDEFPLKVESPYSQMEYEITDVQSENQTEETGFEKQFALKIPVSNPTPNSIAVPTEFFQHNSKDQFNQLYGIESKSNSIFPTSPSFQLSRQIKEFVRTRRRARHRFQINYFLSEENLTNEWKKRKEYYNKIDFFQKQFTQFFYRHNLPPIDITQYIITNQGITIEKTNYPISDLLEKIDLSEYASEQIISLTNNFFPIQQHFKPRQMSGYIYPDTPTDQVWWLGIRFYSQFRHLIAPSEIGIKIPLPPSFVSHFKYYLPSVMGPQIKLKQSFIELVDPEEFVMYMGYFGPAVEKNPETDDVMVSNPRAVSTWSNLYFGHANPLKDRRDGFFGLNREKASPDHLEFEIDFQKNRAFIDGISFHDRDMSQNIDFEPNFSKKPVVYDYFPVVPTRSRAAMPYIDETEWYKKIERIFAEGHKEKVSYPIFSISEPAQKSILWPRTQLDYQSRTNLSSIFRDRFGLATKPIPVINHSMAPTQSLVNDLSVDKNRFDLIYQKLPQPYPYTPDETNRFSLERIRYALISPFIDIQEPITAQSWLVITKISVFLFLVKSLQEVYALYGKELVNYFLELVAEFGLIDEEVREILEDDEEKKSYRILTNVKEQFNQLLGLNDLILEVADITMALRARSDTGKPSPLQQYLPKGILLIGPPGTGKTSFARSLAGETNLPILIESGRAIATPKSKVSPRERLKMVFSKAREIAPCILFLDEIDSLGRARETIVQQEAGGLYEFFYKPETVTAVEEEFNRYQYIPEPISEDTKEDPDIAKHDLAVYKMVEEQLAQKRKVNLLTQLLVELDGLQRLTGVFVIGATNRQGALDPALIRPGRFDRKLYFSLPYREQRIDILQFYGKRLGFEGPIHWDYLANRTRYFNSADLAIIMNESALHAIMNNTLHTIETIEKGIELVTSDSPDKPPMKRKFFQSDPFFISRHAYYQAGKAVVHSFLPKHPPIAILYLWPRVPNARYSRMHEKMFFDSPFRSDLETRLVGFYAGKAAELFLIGSNYETLSNFGMSDLGSQDLHYGVLLSLMMIDDWFLYSNRLASRHIFCDLRTSQNDKEIRYLERVEKFKVAFQEFEWDHRFEKEVTKELPADLKDWSIRQLGWWRWHVSFEFDYVNRKYSDWWRWYVSDKKKKKWNLDILPTDQNYFDSDRLESLSQNSTSTLTVNDLYQIDRDYLLHSLILSAFNEAFCLVDQHRELLDMCADHLLRHQLLRQYELETLLNQYLAKYPKLKHTKQQMDFKQKNKPDPFKDPDLIEAETELVVDKSWGPASRRKVSKVLNIPRFIQSIKIESDYPEFDYYQELSFMREFRKELIKKRIARSRQVARENISAVQAAEAAKSEDDTLKQTEIPAAETPFDKSKKEQTEKSDEDKN